MADYIFYCFAFLGIVGAMLVVTAVNPVHSVLYLILVFIVSAGVLLLINVEFLALVYVVVYVGAIAVLFLFIVMMLNIRMAELTTSIVSYVPLGFMLGLVLFLEIFYMFKRDLVSGDFGDRYLEWSSIAKEQTNVTILSEVLYTDYVYSFLIAGLVLFVAMVGAIVLTLHHKSDVRRQEVYKQVGRSHKSAVSKVRISLDK